MGGGKSLDFCRLCANSLQKSNDRQKKIYEKQIIFSHLNCLNSSAWSVTWNAKQTKELTKPFLVCVNLCDCMGLFLILFGSPKALKKHFQLSDENHQWKSLSDVMKGKNTSSWTGIINCSGSDWGQCISTAICPKEVGFARSQTD